MPVAPATIVRTNRSWPGTSTTDSRRPDGSVRLRVAELDRDPARALLRQAVGVDAGQRADQRGLAVVDVAGGAERQRRAAVMPIASALRTAAATRLDLVVGERARVEQHAPVVDPRDHRRVGARAAPAASAIRARASSATAGPSSSSSGSAPPPTLPAARITSARGPDRRRAAARPGAASVCLVGRRASPAPGSRAARAGVAVQPQRRLERGQRQLVDPQRARQRDGGARPRPPPGAPDDQPGLRAAEQLVARAADQRRAGGDRALQRRLVASAGIPAASASTPEPTSSITGTPEPAQRLDRDLLDEPERPEVRLVHAQDRADVVVGLERALVVAEPRPVGRPDLDQPRARLRDHLGDPEAAADLDQLAARDDDRPARAGQRGRGQQHGAARRC